MMGHLSKSITLKHLLIEEKKQIGIQFYPDKVIQAIIKQLPEPKWSKTYGMVYIMNTKENLIEIFDRFRGIAWVNCNYFSKIEFCRIVINHWMSNGSEEGNYPEAARFVPRSISEC